MSLYCPFSNVWVVWVGKAAAQLTLPPTLSLVAAASAAAAAVLVNAAYYVCV